MADSNQVGRTKTAPLIETAPQMETAPPLSFIVPVLNEADGIEQFLQSLRACCQQPCEIIVVDGGSSDATATLAAPHCDHVIASAKGRAAQMNAGARRSTGTLLCFVHADSSLPTAADQNIRAALGGGVRKWGRFDVRLSGRHPLLRFIGHPDEAVNLPWITSNAPNQRVIVIDAKAIKPIIGPSTAPILARRMAAAYIS